VCAVSTARVYRPKHGDGIMEVYLKTTYLYNQRFTCSILYATTAVTGSLRASLPSHTLPPQSTANRQQLYNNMPPDMWQHRVRGIGIMRFGIFSNILFTQSISLSLLYYIIIIINLIFFSALYSRETRNFGISRNATPIIIYL